MIPHGETAPWTRSLPLPILRGSLHKSTLRHYSYRFASLCPGSASCMVALQFRQSLGMKQKTHITFKLNGERTEVAFAPHKTLLEVLREDLNLTGTKHG